MPFNPRDFLTSVVTFVFSSGGIFNALRIHNNIGVFTKYAKNEIAKSKRSKVGKTRL
jgi:ABC-type transporter Mla maintaining outer membrane lipid asymmetry ATPase subunit MlaF